MKGILTIDINIDIFAKKGKEQVAMTVKRKQICSLPVAKVIDYFFILLHIFAMYGVLILYNTMPCTLA